MYSSGPSSTAQGARAGRTGAGREPVPLRDAVAEMTGFISMEAAAAGRDNERTQTDPVEFTAA
ncbi:hypothetical protein CC1G_13766 [Coprinopsis cinerea okayama7|uniref:Uncharacterized protein n=1 Tax=Coprinopsis cinerea (strain Okayama-7 / 130 / ATCC MYA-4618 / FGSC 9003) TaxID=240176 RepID=D6RKB3_COPC7|nr:hypothetical protein CC1G_13766 [Coprinopsis cinerea okayama7\|eukprot:XP_002912234.1 hypothetical protein CC1G_13766 [Coprinopsis cinerea okayama7\